MRLELAEMHVDVQAYVNAVRADDLWQYAAEEWYKLYAPYVPYDTGALCENVVITPGEIWHTAEYAPLVYAGGFDFRRDVHPLATGRWDEAAAQMRLSQLADALQAYVDAGGLTQK